MKSIRRRSFFWCVFSRIRTEYGEIQSFSPDAGNADQKIHRIWTLLTQWIIELLNQNSVRTASEVRGFINGKGKIGDFNNTKWGQYKYYLMKKRK